MRTIVLYDRILTLNFYICFVLLVMNSPQSIHFLKVGTLPEPLIFTTILSLSLCVLLTHRKDLQIDRLM